MTYINYFPKLEDIKKLLAKWARRILTPIGYIAVIKSLVLSKIVHLISSLPNPNADMITDLNKMFFNFLWKCSPDKTKRKVIVQDYKDGGLKMVDVQNFMNALKVSWIRRRFMDNKKYLIIFKTMYPFMKDFYNYREHFCHKNIHRISNLFWKDVFLSYEHVLDRAYPLNWSDFCHNHCGLINS